MLGKKRFLVSTILIYSFFIFTLTGAYDNEEIEWYDRISPRLEERIKIFLYNRLIPGGIRVSNPEQLNAENFNKSQPIKFVIHGWAPTGKDEMTTRIKDEYLTYTETNIFVVDWTAIAHSYWYPIVAWKIDKVAVLYADFLRRLIKTMEIDTRKLHLIGHSLGAHISGRVGKIFNKEDKMIIGRITGLDPARMIVSKSINRTDAEFVDIIHSAGPELSPLNADGHVDYYPNGGVVPQPGCGLLLSFAIACSHSRSWQLFAESIHHTFICVKCDSWESFKNGYCSDEYVEMYNGQASPKVPKGTYYFTTSDEEPFSLGMSGLKSRCYKDMC